MTKLAKSRKALRVKCKAEEKRDKCINFQPLVNGCTPLPGDFKGFIKADKRCKKIENIGKKLESQEFGGQHST